MKEIFKKIKNKYCLRKFEKNKDKPLHISRIKRAKAMDIILKKCAEYYKNRETHEIRLSDLDSPIFEKLCIPSTETNLLMNIMVDLGYIEYKKCKNDEEYVVHTIKGVQKFIEGGFICEAKKERNTERLIRLGQIASVIGGLYAAVKFFETFLPLLIC